MGSLVKSFSIVGIVSQLIWSLLLFSSFGVEQVLNGFGGLGPFLIGALVLSTIIGWLMMVAYLFSNEEIESKTLWFFALLFLPGQFIFWIQFILDSDAIEEMNEPTFNRNSFIEEYKTVSRAQKVAQPVADWPTASAPKRSRGLTPPAFIALKRQPNDSRPQL